jgi:CheY-like chemotaxis protein
MRILVIEDHPSELKLAHHVLSAAGHDVSDAEAAQGALAAIKRERPQLILLDMSLPDMDGLTLARNLKADPETTDIPIVGVTSFPERYSHAEALSAGCEAYFVKPISTRKLSDQLDAIATSHSARSSA